MIQSLKPSCLAVCALAIGFSLATPAKGAPKQEAAIYQFQSCISNGLDSDPTYATDDAHAQPNSGRSDDNFNEPKIRLKSSTGGDPVYGILKFDVSAAKGVTVASASLTLTIKYGGGGNLISQSLYALPFGNTIWQEGSVTFNNQDGATPWKDINDSPVNLMLAGTSGTLLDSFHQVELVPGETVTFNIDPSVAQAWVDDPASFTGLFLMQTEGNDRVFYASGEDSTSSDRPLLTITAAPKPLSQRQ